MLVFSNSNTLFRIKTTGFPNIWPSRLLESIHIAVFDRFFIAPNLDPTLFLDPNILI